MNTNLPKRYQVVSPDDNLDKIDVKRIKREGVHQISSSLADNKYDVQLCKMNAGKSLQNETFPNFNDSAELGKYVLNFYLCYYIYIHLYSSYFN